MYTLLGSSRVSLMSRDEYPVVFLMNLVVLVEIGCKPMHFYFALTYKREILEIKSNLNTSNILTKQL